MASLAYKHNSYYAVFSINGRKKWIRIGRVVKKEARKILKQLELEHIKGRLEINEIREMLFYDYLDEYLRYSRTNKAGSTYYRELQVVKHLRLTFGNVCIEKIDNKAIENYKSTRVKQGLAPSSVNRELTVLSDMLKKAVAWNYIERVPSFSILKLPTRPPKFLSVDQLKRLIDCSTPWLKPILIVLRNTGMRIGEVLGLQFSDIDIENKVIDLPRYNRTIV